MLQKIAAAVPYNSPGYTPGRDYKVRRCPRCNRRCWVGPIQQLAIDCGKMQLLCMACIVRMCPGVKE